MTFRIMLYTVTLMGVAMTCPLVRDRDVMLCGYILWGLGLLELLILNGIEAYRERE